MKGDQDVGHFLDLLDAIVSLDGINMNPWCDSRPGGRKVLIVAAKTGDNRLSLLRLSHAISKKT
jgi:hypothetical protein